MTVCAVINNATNEQVNLIVASPTDPAPNGCRLVELPVGFKWNGIEAVPVGLTDAD